VNRIDPVGIEPLGSCMYASALRILKFLLRQMQLAPIARTSALRPHEFVHSPPTICIVIRFT